MNGMKSLLPKRALKIDDIVNITETDKLITVEVKKDMLLKIDGNMLSVVKGLNVFLAKELHWNPNIPASMKDIELNIDNYKKEQLRLLNDYKKEQLRLQANKKDCNCKNKKA